MPTISFRCKLDGPQCGTVPEWMKTEHAGKRWMKLPEKITSGHFDRTQFHRDSRFGSYSNSDLLPSLILRTLRDTGAIYQSGDTWRLLLDHPSVSITPGFLATIQVAI